MPADFLSRSQFDEVVAKINAKAIAAAIDPFTPSLAEEQANDSDMIKFKQFAHPQCNAQVKVFNKL